MYIYNFKRKFKGNPWLKAFSLLVPIFLLTACSNPFSIESQINSFNKRYAPEYYLSKTHLQVNWPDNPQQDIAPLKLKIPVAYLSGAMDEKNEFETVIWALKPMENRKIDTIYLKLRRSNGHPVPYVYPKKTDNPEITRKQKEIYADEYVAKIFRDAKGDVLNRERDYCGEGEELFRGNDISGLEQYVKMTCYDLQALQKKALDPNYQESSKWTLKDLANKPSYDITPANCLADARTDFWRSPINTPQAMAVKIDSSHSIAGYQISFLYKNHLVIAYPREGGEEMAEDWKFYHQQITQVLDSMLVQ